ncbi:MAG TPA: PP2C family protein-serine/threonine phosphatase [Thermoanaerobaculia bacterium]|nr:PP2C family protein-serine/threonine phosphatase [Thermoanaerobaculia bacterium]
MKRLAPFIVCVAGIVALWFLIPRFNASQPHGIKLTRGQAKAIADREAKKAGIEVERAWSILTWAGSGPLDQELDRSPELRRQAAADPVIGPRFGGYHATYYRRGLEKFQPYGDIVIDAGSGEVLMWRRRMRAEEPGERLEEGEIRRRADALIASRSFPGAPNPQFEDARPTRLRNRTDWIVRYRVPSTFDTGKVVPYLWVYFTGGQLGGWALIEEYADGSNFRGDNAGEFAGLFLQYGVMYALLVVLLTIFLKKYHAGEVGVGTASLLFAFLVGLSVIQHLLTGPSASEGVGLGSLTAVQVAWARAGFGFLLFDIPAAVLAFFAWAVGESYARERWGERLASFDALLRRDPLNATTGRSVLRGLLASPAIAAAALLIALVPILLGLAHQTEGSGTFGIVVMGGPAVAVNSAAIQAISFSVIAILFVLAAANRRRVMWIGIVVAIVFGAIWALAEPPIEPYAQRVLFGFGATLGAIAVFLAWDLLATVVALFGGALLVSALPLLSVSTGDLFRQLLSWVAVPNALMLVFAMVALMTKREVVYTYEDLAPHVKRIVERERVKAEIDAANRIQAALLPLDTPNLAGASVSSHYRAATEIGGDYFDFLPQPSGEIGIAFGDVSGHGLTSGIVMAMAKSALLVQVDHDPSPRAVMNVLNEIVIRTAPKRILMTFFFGMLDPRTQTLRFSSAGHLDPYVFRSNGRRIEALSSWGFPLGVKRREPFREHTVDFSAGDRLVLYSDGLIEAIDDDGEPFGFERFEKTILESGHLSADDIKKSLLSAVKKFTHNRPPEDDQTLVVVSFDESVAEILPRRAVVAGFSESIN